MLAACVLGGSGCLAPRSSSPAAADEPRAQQVAQVYGPPAPPLQAPERPEGWQGPEPPAESEEAGLVEGVRSTVTRRARETAAWIDAFLSDERSLAEENSTWVRLRLDASVEEDQGFDFSPRLSARVVLPKSEERLQLFVSGDPDAETDPESLLDEEPLPTIEDEEQRDFALGLQYFVQQSKRNNIRLELGTRFDGITPDPFVGARWRYLTSLLSWTLRATERVRWYVSTGWESRTTVDLERPLSERFFLRSTARLSWYEDEDGLFYGGTLRLYQRLPGERLLTYEWNSSLETEPVDRVKESRLRLRYAQRFLRDWILLELAPQVAWRDDDDFDPAYGLQLRLELMFGAEQPVPDLAR